MLAQNKLILIIAATASRLYVKAAVEAGYEVIAIDCFADADTKYLAKNVYQVPLRNGCLDSEHVLDVVKSLAPQGIAGFCYGAGFEMQPTILGEINQYIIVIGNAEDVVMHCKDPDRFFSVCDKLGVPHPKVMLDRPHSANGWLQKKIGGSGGVNIRPLHVSENEVLEDVYFQQHQTGQPISCLFLANANDVEIIGFNQQWLDDNESEPFRYGGAVSQAKISDLAKTRFTSYVGKLVQAIGLVGLNSCDAICDGDDVYLLEVNPRLSATMGLYSSEYPALFAQHVKASEKGSLQSFISHGVSLASAAHQVIYAQGDMFIGRDFTWPEWVADIPEGGSSFKVGMPVCTVLAEASTASQAKNLVQNRVTTLNKQFLN